MYGKAVTNGADGDAKISPTDLENDDATSKRPIAEIGLLKFSLSRFFDFSIS
jgi:hypothetical protein